MQWAGVGMWMVLGLSACSPTKKGQRIFLVGKLSFKRIA